MRRLTRASLALARLPLALAVLVWLACNWADQP